MQMQCFSKKQLRRFFNTIDLIKSDGRRGEPDGGGRPGEPDGEGRSTEGREPDGENQRVDLGQRDGRESSEKYTDRALKLRPLPQRGVCMYVYVYVCMYVCICMYAL